ncbi:MAG: branched-chain amino acid ABC transporter permease [Candidatus Eremiobacteraeota bacterium]|nr:branched-chain amino acid ABC transporter permease [Candidatus Eremiobacteraeota bacterium]MBV8367152.1 branched-chain amino acid ABC transporter permease [Candidatus Eremiobacteraeota bacterium]
MIARAAALDRRIALALALGALALGLLLPHVLYVGLATDIVIWALFAAAFDLLLGYTGLLSFGHAMFFGGASYVAGLLILRAHWSFFPAVAAAVLAATAIAALVGAIAIRRQGIYFAMITLAFGQMLYFLANQFGDWTGGQDGLQNVQRPTLIAGIRLDNDTLLYYIALAAAVLGVASVLRVVNSPFGRVLSAIRENEPRATSLGYRTSAYKLVAFVLSGALAGLAGALFVIAHRFTSLDTLDWHTSGEVVIMTVLGGIGTVFGPLFGAPFYLIINDRLSTLTTSPGLVLGIIFIIVVSVFRRGMIGELVYALRRRRHVEHVAPGA